MRKLVHVLCVLGLVTALGCSGDDDPSGVAGAAGEGGSSGEGGDSGVSGEGGAGGDSGVSGAGGSGGDSGQGGSGGDSGEGGMGGDGGNEPPVIVPLAQVPSSLAGAICDALLGCLGESKLREVAGREDCEDRVTEELENGELAYIEDSIAAGRVLYNPAQLEDCLEGIRDMGCAVATDTYPDACVEVLAGNVPLDSECTISSECAGTAFCAGRDACPSTCQPLLGAGDACAADDECGDDLLCIGGECTELAAEGDDCGGTTGVICAIGLSCINFTEAPGECTANAEVQAGELDDECSPTGTLCKEGLSCVPVDGDTEEWRCLEGVDGGETCRLALPGQCPVDHFCDAAEFYADGTCIPLPTDGEACVLTQLLCAPGFACVVEGEDPLCRSIVDNGGTCSGDAACRSGNCTGGECAPPVVCE
jgi:hypothetical protein